MKVVFLAYEYPPFSFGGIGSFSKDLTLALSREDIKLVVVAFTPHRQFSIEMINNNLIIYRIPGINFPPRHIWWQACNYRAIKNLLKWLKPDLIHSNNLVASLLLRDISRHWEVPQVLTVHGDNHSILEILMSEKKMLAPRDFLTYVCFQPLYERLFRLESKVVNSVVAVSHHLEKDLKKRYRIQNVTTIYNGVIVPDEFITRTAVLKQSHYQRKKVKLAYVGRLYWVKGVSYALEAFSILINKLGKKNFEFNIYGDGPLIQHLKNYSSSKKLCSFVHFYGQLPRERVFAEMIDSDIVLFPSLYEACPIALFEAMSLEKPVIVSDANWSLEFIENYVNGLRVDIKDPNIFAEKILQLSEDMKLRDDIVRKAKEKLEIYSIEKIAKSYKQLYERLQS